MTLTFSYRNASSMRNDGEVSYILVGFQVQDQIVAGLRFYNDGEKRPRVEVNPIDLVRYELDTPAWASPWLARELLQRKDVIRSGEAASDEFHTVTMRYDAHSRKVTIDGDEVGHVEGEARYNKLSRGSLCIQTFYPMTVSRRRSTSRTSRSRVRPLNCILVISLPQMKVRWPSKYPPKSVNLYY